jgi:hypothetical protein
MANLSHVLSWSLQPIGEGSEGYFTIDSLAGISPPPMLYQLTADNNVKLISAKPLSLSAAVMYSQPALNYDNPKKPTQLMAIDVVNDKQVWTSNDPFLVGADWGKNDTFSHYSTSYQLLESRPGQFIVLNAAYDYNKTVVAQAGMYDLSNGKEVARSPVLTFDHLYHPEANPTTWQFDDILLLRGDTVWYMLQLPSLEPTKRGQYATADASLLSNNWLVDPDGSYVALAYHDQAAISGYPPYAVKQTGLSEQVSVGERRHVRGVCEAGIKQ